MGNWTQPSTPLETWTQKDIFEWISSDPSLKSIAQILKKEEIDGRSLLLKSEDNLKEMGIKMGPRKILNEKIRLKKEEDQKSMQIMNISSHEYEIIKSKLSFKNMMFLKDGISGVFIHLPSDLAAAIQRIVPVAISPTLYQFATASIQLHDVILAPLVLAIQATVNISRWYCGDITGKQLWKNMAVNTTVVASAIGGTVAGIATATAIGAALGTVVGPAGTICGGIAGALIFAFCGGLLSRSILEYLFPDGPEEEFINKFNAMLDALAYLGCTPSSTDEEVRKSKNRGVLLYHPDRNIHNYDKTKQAKFLRVVLSYEIVINYRKFIRKAQKNLRFETNEKDKAIDNLKKRWEKISNEFDNSIANLNKEINSINQSTKLEKSTVDKHWNKIEDEEKIEDINKKINEIQKKKKEMEYFYDCLVIHYENRTHKAFPRKILDFFDFKSKPYTMFDLDEDEDDQKNEILLLGWHPTNTNE